MYFKLCNTDRLLPKGAVSSLEHAHSGREIQVFRGPREIQLSAIVCRDSVIRSNSYCFFCHRDNNRCRFEKVPRLDYSLKKFCIFFDRYAKKWLQERQKCEDLSADRCFLLSMPYFFVFAGVAGTFLLDCWAWYCHKFLQKQRHLVTSVPSPSRS